jgi:predicted ATPase
VAGVSARAPFVFERAGDYWTIGAGDERFRIRDSKGLRCLDELLGNPEREIHALDLSARASGGIDPGLAGRSAAAADLGLDPGSPSTDGAGPLLDPKAKEEYRRRLEDLREEIEEAENFHDSERATRAKEEYEFVANELSAAVGLGGRDRATGSAAERARVNVTRSIRSAIAKIEQNDTALGRYLDAAISTGTFCSYTPLQEVPSSGASRHEPRSGPDHNLGADLTSFVGRTEELASVDALLSKHRVITLCGPGGAGKTRLARQVAQHVLPRMPGGAWLVELAPLKDDAVVAPAVAAALGVQDERGGPLIDGLAAAIAHRELLMVLDNCEHVLDSVSSLAAELLQRCSRVQVLATSREPLQIQGEAVWRVPPLTPDDALSLLGERLDASRGALASAEADADVLTKIAERLDRLPLALELAAARARSLSLEELASKLDQRFDLLQGPTRGAPERHQTLRATVEWSHESLDERERVLFRRFAVFAGGCTTRGAERVCGGPDGSEREVLELLTALAERSLIDAQTIGAETRWTMLETLRQFAAERLEEAGETAMLRDAHLAWAADLAEASYAGLEGPEQRMWLRRMDDEHANVLEALSWAREGSADLLRLVAAMTTYWFMRVRPEASDWLETALRTCPEGPPQLRARVLYGLGMLQKQMTNHDEAEATFEQAVLCASDDRAGDTREEALARLLLAELRSYRTKDGVRELIDRALDIGERTGDDVVLAYAHAWLGCVLGRWGEDRAATDAFDRCLQIARDIGHDRLFAKTLADRAIEAWYVGDLEAALAFAREGYDSSRTLGDRYALQFAAGILGESLAMSGDAEEGRRLVRERLESTRTANLSLQANLALEQLASLAPDDLAKDAAVTIGHTTAGYIVRSDEDVYRHERMMAWLEERLGTDGVAAALDEGAALDPPAVEEIVLRLAAATGPAGAFALAPRPT